MAGNSGHLRLLNEGMTAKKAGRISCRQKMAFRVIFASTRQLLATKERLLPAPCRSHSATTAAAPNSPHQLSIRF
ncbi:hypothetical protein [Pulveribacter sp.]|uniref:hypothetical protein n=1 Tax=Pulveribacter sp. TaxID=2678893 RepID=UPI0028A9AEFE|nr:hypothetical protein [Pulveribacter sp.]